MSPAARPKHVPIRTCVGCRTAGDKRGLMRVVRTPDGPVAFDPTGRAAGRGAYLCADEKCIGLAQKKRILDRHLRQPTPPELYEALLAEAAARAVNLDGTDATHGTYAASAKAATSGGARGDGHAARA
ncbi:MAG: YlxR family protein [Armatimonadetes bacterium]|nr:YlxR family protein [Armatimonadota bacterium]